MLVERAHLENDVAEIYEWLAEKYPSYLYTKRKIRHVLRHDSERTSPRFVIANKNRIAGASIRWTIRPGTEAQLRRSFSDPPPAEPQFPRSYGGLSQLIHCVLCNRRFDRHESVARHQREAHPSEPGMGSKHAAGEAPPEDQSSAITNTRRDRTWGRRPSEEPLSILTSFEEVDGSEVVQSPDVRGNGALQRRLRDCSRRELSVDGSANHKFYTKAAIVSARGIIEAAYTTFFLDR